MTIADITSIANVSLNFLLVAFAAIAGFVAWKNLKVLREQSKQHTLLALLTELSEEKARKNRKLILENLPSSARVTNIREGILRDDPSTTIYSDAIEETISLLDRVGFFLLKGDPSIKNDAPIWIWTITSQMWGKIDWYVTHRKQAHQNYAKYFENLAIEARKRGFVSETAITQLQNH